MSMSSVWRLFRPSKDPETLRYWADRLDIKRRASDAALHCSAAAVEALRNELAAESDGGAVAYGAARGWRFKPSAVAFQRRGGEDAAASPRE